MKEHFTQNPNQTGTDHHVNMARKLSETIRKKVMINLTRNFAYNRVHGATNADEAFMVNNFTDNHE